MIDCSRSIITGSEWSGAYGVFGFSEWEGFDVEGEIKCLGEREGERERRPEGRMRRDRNLVRGNCCRFE